MTLPRPRVVTRRRRTGIPPRGSDAPSLAPQPPTRLRIKTTSATASCHTECGCRSRRRTRAAIRTVSLLKSIVIVCVETFTQKKVVIEKGPTARVDSLISLSPFLSRLPVAAPVPSACRRVFFFDHFLSGQEREAFSQDK
jgi:hypothetical protein